MSVYLFVENDVGIVKTDCSTVPEAMEKYPDEYEENGIVLWLGKGSVEHLLKGINKGLSSNKEFYSGSITSNLDMLVFGTDDEEEYETHNDESYSIPEYFWTLGSKESLLSFKLSAENALKENR